MNERTYIPKHPLVWVSSHAEAHKYECTDYWEGYSGATLVAFVMTYDHASYGFVGGQRLGASMAADDLSSITIAKCRVNYRWDCLHEKPDFVDMSSQMTVEEMRAEKILMGETLH